jgi:hypothetical protein
MSTTVNTNVRTVSTSSTQSSTDLSASEAKAAWQNVLNQSLDSDSKLKGSTVYLGEGRIDRYKGKVAADMEKYVQEHPHASAQEISDYCNDRISKHKGYETVSKMTDDYFMSRMMARAKELLADLWE